MTGKVTHADYKAEYLHALQEIKELAKEYDDSVPESLKERLKKKVQYAYSQLEMDPDIPAHKRASTLMADLQITLNVVIPRATLYRWIDHKGDEKEDENLSQMRQNNSSIYCDACKTKHTAQELEQENAPIDQVAEKWINFWQGVRLKCRQQHIVSKIPENEREEGIYLLNKSAEATMQEWDGRQDISERRFPVFVKAVLASADKATHLFIKWVKEWIPLTGKQDHKLTHGRATICHPYYQPQTVEEAQELFFQGSPCTFKKCLDCEKREKEQLEKMKEWTDEKPNVKLNINSRADAKICRLCGSTNLVEMGCGERRLMYGTDSIPALTVKCANCHEIFPPLHEKLPVAQGQWLDKKIAETIVNWNNSDNYKEWKKENGL